MLPHGGFVLYNRHVLVVIQVVFVVVEDVEPVVERVGLVIEVPVFDEVQRVGRCSLRVRGVYRADA